MKKISLKINGESIVVEDEIRKNRLEDIAIKDEKNLVKAADNLDNLENALIDHDNKVEKKQKGKSLFSVISGALCGAVALVLPVALISLFKLDATPYLTMVTVVAPCAVVGAGVGIFGGVTSSRTRKTRKAIAKLRNNISTERDTLTRRINNKVQAVPTETKRKVKAPIYQLDIALMLPEDKASGYKFKKEDLPGFINSLLTIATGNDAEFNNVLKLADKYDVSYQLKITNPEISKQHKTKTYEARKKVDTIYKYITEVAYELIDDDELKSAIEAKPEVKKALLENPENLQLILNSPKLQESIKKGIDTFGGNN